MPARVLMLQGTSSSVGKSLLTAALCRLYARRGLRVAPFKAQNMSNNAAVCADGSEIGRAQAVQAVAAGVEPCADMNPVLLKPEADSRCQVIVRGRPWATLQAGSYYQRKRELWPVVTEALERLRGAHDLVLIEGAGSPVELNLQATDIVNMAVARHARAAVLLIGDIDRGGLFAQMLGTLWLLQEDERALVRGLIVNKFRGDRRLFLDGVRILEERGEVPVLGVVPYVPALAIPEEDAATLDVREGLRGAALDVAVVRLPHIANFDDFDPLRSEPGARVRFTASAEVLRQAHAIILPGTKSTVADLSWLRQTGLADVIRQRAGQGAAVVGICGGYQMLGRRIHDPEQVEASAAEVEGLGLLPLDTRFTAAKATHQVRARVLGGPGWLQALAGLEVEGYEIHAGHGSSTRPWLELQRRGGQDRLVDGAVDEMGRVWGCYLHGLFASAVLRRAWLASLGVAVEGPGAASLDELLDQLADAVEAALDVERLSEIINTSGGVP